VLWVFQNIDPTAFAAAQSGSRDDTADRIAEAEHQIQSIGRQVQKLTALIINDDAPSPSLVTALKAQEAQLLTAESCLEALKVQKKPELPPVPDDLTVPAVRRALRKEIARWCSKVEIFADHFVFWLTVKYGIKVPLEGEPAAIYHAPEQFAAEAAEAAAVA